MVNEQHAPSLPAELAALFADGGAGRVLPVPLPEGQLVWPDPNHPDLEAGEAARRPTHWVSAAPVPDQLWPQLRPAHDQSGLWPLLLVESRIKPTWQEGYAEPEPVGDIDALDVADVLAGWWAKLPEKGIEVHQLHPFGRDWPVPSAQQVIEVHQLYPFGGRDWPLPAPPAQQVEDPGVSADRLAAQLNDDQTLLGLVPAARSADALVVSGWCRAAPAAVVRSWEDRFGARVVGIGPGALFLSVAAPPVTCAHAVGVAAEHVAFCPANLWHSSWDPHHVEDYAAGIRGKRQWSFWWQD